MNSTVLGKVIVVCYVLMTLSLFLYSYTQVDLNFTLTTLSITQIVQKMFQEIGFYNRPLSTILFISIISILYILYFLTLYAIRQQSFSKKSFWKITIFTSLVLLFSYPAFSYDIFNYMFTAKTVVFYHKNPYMVIPLDFQSIEPWLAVMRWTHLPSAYTPLWIFISLPAYFFGFGITLLTLWNTKLLIVMFHLFTIWVIGKIIAKIDGKHELLAMAIFALNPLIIIENLVSAHNDVVMMSLALFAIYLYIVKKRLNSIFILALSVGTKLMTLFLLPIFFIGIKRRILLLLMLIGLAMVVSQREILSWYWVWIMPFIALLPTSTNLLIIASGVSFGLLLRYAPYLYTGNYDYPVKIIRDYITFIPIIFAVCTVLFLKLLSKKPIVR